MKNVIGSAKRIAKKTWWPARWLVPLVSAPVALGCVAAVWVGYRELRAAGELQRLTEPLEEGERLAGESRVEQMLRDSTSTEGTALWSQIYMLTNAGNSTVSQDLPIMGTAPLPNLLNRDQPWEANERVGQYLEEMRPVTELIHQAVKLPTPVWQPLTFDGFRTLLPHVQAAIGPARLLQLEAEYAIYHEDAPRAMQALAALQATGDSIDWDIFIVVQTYHFIMQDMAFETLQRSLWTDVWNAEELTQFMEQTDQPIDINETFRKGIRGEKAWVEGTLTDERGLPSGVRLIGFPNAKRELLRHYDVIWELAVKSSERLSTRINNYELSAWNGTRKGVSGILASEFSPAASSFAASLEISEQSRQLTHVGLALKRFQLEYERWPEELSELSCYGLSTRDWTLAGVGQFGFEVDGGRAYVWGLARDERTIAEQRPVVALDELDEAYQMVVVSPKVGGEEN